MAKRAFELREGDYINPNNWGSLAHKVASVTVDGVDIIIQTNEGVWTFRQDELVQFPRRADGSRRRWSSPEGLEASSLMIGDLVPPAAGWTFDEDDTPLLSDGYLVTAVSYGVRGTYVTLYSGSTQQAARVFVSIRGDGLLYGDKARFEEYHSTTAAKPKKNVSGLYRNTRTRELARFRVSTGPGRPPAGTIKAPTLLDDWNEWELQDGEQPHPYDPRHRQVR